MATTSRFGLEYLEEGQQNAEVGHNTSLDILSTMLGLYVISRTTATPPAVIEGEAYIIPADASGEEWEDHVGEIAVGLNEGWTFLEPENGLQFFIEDENCGGIYLNGFQIRNPAPRFAARRANTQNLTGETDILWDTQMVLDAYFTHTVSSAEITIASAGYHECLANVTLERTAGSGNTVFVVRLYVNGVLVPGAVAYGLCSDTATPATVALNAMFDVSSPGLNAKLTVAVVSGSATLRIANAGTRVIITRP